MDLTNLICSAIALFFIWYFLQTKNEIAHFIWGVAFAFAQALRRFAPCRISVSRPFFCIDSKAKKHEACQGFASYR